MNDAVGASDRCAACGNGGEGLKACAGCNLVKYCDRRCQMAHRPEHKEECLEQFHRELMKQPPKHYMGDCPICMLPLPVEARYTTYQSCCGKALCAGCLYFGAKFERERRGSHQTCPFCKTEMAASVKEDKKRLQKRVDANDPDACTLYGVRYFRGGPGYHQDITRGMELLHRAQKLGSIHACHTLGLAYYNGEEGVGKDVKKGIQYFQRGAMGGNPKCRHELGSREHRSGKVSLAYAHWLIAAEAGYDPSLECIKGGYMKGEVDKSVLERALRAHKETTDEVKSEQRDFAKQDQAANRLM